MIDILRNNLQLADISYKRADWANFRECDDIVKGGEVIWTSSPYDAATTAYLKATYPAYWNEIKAFGKSHPNLVPFVNEDNDLIVSLVEVGKERMLNNNGTGAYINLGKNGVMADTYEMEFQYNRGGSYRSWGVFGQSSYTGLNMSLTYSGGISVRWESRSGGSSQVDNLAPTSSTTLHKLKIEDGLITFDGVNKGRSAGHNTNTVINYPMYLFTINPANTAPTATIDGKFGTYTHTSKSGELVQKCVPVCHNGECGMLDIVDATFHGNIAGRGSFTIELTDTPS